MKLGTAGFVGGKLAEAREARGLTVGSLAELVGISSQNISQYEHAKQSPSPEVMSRICERLNFDLRFFQRPVADTDLERVYFRSMSSATKGARTKALRRFSWLKEITWYLREWLELPKINIPAFNLPSDVLTISTDLIEEIAAECRRYWQLGDGPIPDVVLTLENNGVIVSSSKLETEALEAFSQWCKKDGTPYLVLGTEKNIAARMRFNAAHELGHLLLHRGLERKHLNSTIIHKAVEEQAHRFAGAFLLPANKFAEEVWAPNLEGFRSLKGYWRVSIGAMISRCEQLGIIGADQSRRLWIYMNRKDWRKREPLDDQLEPERPRLLRRSFQMLVDEGLRTRDQIVNDLRLTPSDVEELALLPMGFFNGLEFVTPKVRELEPRRIGNGGIVSFPNRETED